MRLPPLGLLRGGMHVAEAVLERAVVEDGPRAGAVIERVDDLASLVDGPQVEAGRRGPPFPAKAGREGLCKLLPRPACGVRGP